MRKTSRLWLFSLLLVVNSSLGSAAEIDSKVGKRIVEDLRKALRNDTTSLRKETKSVLTEKSISAIGRALAKGYRTPEHTRIVPELSVRTSQVPNGKNATFTFYGQRVFFKNETLKTSIKLRARFYLHLMNDGSLNRSPNTSDEAFLELKVKNPTPGEKNAVNKIRVKIADKDLLTLFHADPARPEFIQTLQNVEDNVLALPSNHADRDLIPVIFKTIRELVRLEPKFISPLVGIYYERIAFSCMEKNYGRQDAANPLSLGDVEFQFTFDRNVRGYLPNLWASNDFDFDNYFRRDMERDLIVNYPKNSVVAEAKIPMKVANLKTSQRSLLHKFFDDVMVKKMIDEAIREGDFRPNHGKAGYLIKMINP